jgi:hypothetical protein
MPVFLMGTVSAVTTLLRVQHDASRSSLVNMDEGDLLSRGGQVVDLAHRDDKQGTVEVTVSRSSEPSRWTVTGYGFMDQLVALLVDGEAAGVWSVPDPGLTAVLIFCGLHGVVDDVLLRKGDPTLAVPKIVELARRVVAVR